MPDNSSLVDAREAALYLQISTSSLAKWRISGFGPKFSKLGRAVRYRIADLDDFVTRNSVNNTTQAASVRYLKVGV